MQLHRSRDEGLIVGEKVTGLHAPRTEQRRRICAEAACGVLLSIYNHSDWCSLHEECMAAPGRYGY